MFAYIQHRIPEISDEVYRIDDAMKAGFGWTHGPFEIWDAIGLETGIATTESPNRYKEGKHWFCGFDRAPGVIQPVLNAQYRHVDMQTHS